MTSKSNAQSVLIVLSVALFPVDALAQAAAPGRAGITYQLTNGNPRVGESATIAAKLVGPGGVEIPGSKCVLDPSPAYVTVTPDGSITAIRKTPPGQNATLHIRCQDASGIQSTLQAPLVVRGRLVQLQLNKLGTGKGSLMAFPPVGLGYEEDTEVRVSAKPIGKSVLRNPPFSGDCDPHTGYVRMTRDMQCSAYFYENRDARERAERAEQAARGVATSGSPSSPAGGSSGERGGGPRASGGGGAGKAVAFVAVVGSLGAGAYFLGQYLAKQNGVQASGNDARVSTRTCTISALTGACSCVGSTNVPAPAGIPTPAAAGGACVSNACQAGLSCNNGRCEGPTGRCPF